ncbi:hypothetical protein FGAF138_0550 (plasmid) [Escherichia coli]|nr:hypothetical protein FGAF138_0550 [Escherichia coli]
MLRFFVGEDDLLPFREKLLQRGNQLRVFGRNGVSYGLFVNAKPGQALIGVSLDIENYCTLRLFFDLSTLAGLSRRNLPEAGIRLLFQI